MSFLVFILRSGQENHEVELERMTLIALRILQDTPSVGIAPRKVDIFISSITPTNTL